MERIEKTVFISYRRTNIPWALAIFQNLQANGYDAFFDYNGIASGDFEQVILGNITARAHFLVILTPSALERCKEPSDWLRREIETALRSRRNIVPLMLEGFDFGTPSIANQLTGSLVPIKGYNGLTIPPEYFMEAMGRLRDRFLNVPLSAVLHPNSPIAQTAAIKQMKAAVLAPRVEEAELTAQQWFERGFEDVSSDEKLRFLGNAIRLKPDFASAYVNRGNEHFMRDEVAAALSDYDEAIRINSDHAVAFCNRGNARESNGDREGAIKDLEEAIRLEPELAAAYVHRGYVFYKSGNLEGALKDYGEAIRLKPDNAANYLRRGIVHFDCGELESAFKDYGAAIDVKPDYPLAFNNRGIVREAFGDFDGAFRDYGEAIRIMRDDPIAYVSRGTLYSDRGDIEEALTDFDEAIKLKPDYALAYFYRANAYYKSGDRERAASDLDEAIRLKLEEASIYVLRGNLYSREDSFVAAIHCYNEAIRIQPNYALAFNNRGLSRRANGDLHGAKLDIAEANRLGYPTKWDNDHADS